MTKRILSVLAALLLAVTPALAAGNAIPPPSTGGGSPSGTAAGDLGGSYPNPSVGAINGNSVPPSAAADQTLVGTAANTLGWKSLPDCALPGALNYAVASHSWSCGTPPGTAAGAVAPYTSGLFYQFEGVVAGGTVTNPSIRLFCSPATVRVSVKPATLATAIKTASAGNHLKLAIYADTTSGSASPRHSPGLLLAATGDIATDNLTNATTPTAGQGALATALANPLAPGTIYWRCFIADNTVVATNSSSPTHVFRLIGDSNLVYATVNTTNGLGGLSSSSVQTYATAFQSDLSSLSWGYASASIPDVYFLAP